MFDGDRDLPVLTSGNCVIKGRVISGLWNYTYFFYVILRIFQNQKKTFYVFLSWCTRILEHWVVVAFRVLITTLLYYILVLLKASTCWHRWCKTGSRSGSLDQMSSTSMMMLRNVWTTLLLIQLVTASKHFNDHTQHNAQDYLLLNGNHGNQGTGHGARNCWQNARWSESPSFTELIALLERISSVILASVQPTAALELSNAQNPLATFPRSFPIDGEVTNLIKTCYGLPTGKLRGNWFNGFSALNVLQTAVTATE